MATRIDAEIDVIAQRVLLELESATSKDLSSATYAKKILRLSDVNYTKMMLQQVGSVASGAESETGKRAVIKALLLSTWLQRLYFIIRAFIMGQLGSAITLIFILYLGKIDFAQGVIIGIFGFMFSLVITRLFDAQIALATKKIVGLMATHKTARDFIMNHF